MGDGDHFIKLPWPKEAGDSKIKETFVDSMGQTRPKYKVVTEVTLKRQHRHLRTVVEEGVILGFICQEDGFIMVPKEVKAARFYLNTKDYKPPDPLSHH